MAQKRIFVSHSHDEKRLAAAWRKLLERISDKRLEVWYSSDRALDGGIGPGERWRKKVIRELERREVVLALFTPESQEKPWIFFECAFAEGRRDDADSTVQEVIPVVYYMDLERLPSPLQDLSAIRGDDVEGVQRLAERLIFSPSTPKSALTAWRTENEKAFRKYERSVDKHNETRREISLFYGTFHARIVAKGLRGEWYAKWTQRDGDKEYVYALDTHDVKTTRDRIRFVGSAQKIGKGKQTKSYPMEGLVSSRRVVSLSYWSEGTMPISGTALLRLSPDGTLMQGTWEGYTTLDTRDPDGIGHVRGRVAFVREESELEELFPEAQPL